MEKWYLVPLLTGREDELIDVMKEAGKVVLLFVADDKLKEVPAAFAGSRIRSAETRIEKIKDELHKIRSDIMVTDYIEWGSWDEKIISIAKIESVDTILIKSCEQADLLVPKIKAAMLKAEII